MNRITRDQMFLEMAASAAKRSTCYRANVGAILVGHDHNILSIGYNGPPSGQPHCTGAACTLARSGGCERAVHAEANALERAPKHYRVGATLYCTYSPCAACSLSILREHRIRRVVFQTPYRIIDHLEWFPKHLVTIEQVTPNGMVINPLTKELVS